MIEDGLRGIIADAITDVPVYSRLIPLPMPECICVQEDGGTVVNAGIRRTRHRIVLSACSQDRTRAARLLRIARDVLITHVPGDADGIHYYTATAEGDGSLRRKTANGPRYVEFTDFTVEASL